MINFIVISITKKEIHYIVSWSVLGGNSLFPCMLHEYRWLLFSIVHRSRSWMNAFHFFTGFLLLQTAVLEDESEWQACSTLPCGVCSFLCFASWTLILTVLDKSGLLLEALWFFSMDDITSLADRTTCWHILHQEVLTNLKVACPTNFVL
jgi:hypothetical protein